MSKIDDLIAAYSALAKANRVLHTADETHLANTVAVLAEMVKELIDKEVTSEGR